MSNNKTTDNQTSEEYREDVSNTDYKWITVRPDVCPRVDQR